ncbi:MAG: DUF4870 domain-containing protein [Bacteroidota bacterium]
MSDLSSPILDYDASEEYDYHPTQDEKNIALLSHVLTLLAWFIAPLIIYLVKKDESDYIREHAVESLNFQLSLTIYMIASVVLILVFIGFFLLIGFSIMALVVVIIATIKASEGKPYRYPLTIRFIK